MPQDFYRARLKIGVKRIVVSCNQNIHGRDINMNYDIIPK